MTMPRCDLGRAEPAKTVRWLGAVDTAWLAGTWAQDDTDADLAATADSATAYPDSARVQPIAGRLAAVTMLVRADEAGQSDLIERLGRSFISCALLASYLIWPARLDRCRAVEPT
jgi:hypothetical protein